MNKAIFTGLEDVVEVGVAEGAEVVVEVVHGDTQETSMFKFFCQGFAIGGYILECINHLRHNSMFFVS